MTLFADLPWWQQLFWFLVVVGGTDWLAAHLVWPRRPPTDQDSP